ncbi:MAG: quinone oxidoreductase [Pseudomonadota bacterium]
MTEIGAIRMETTGEPDVMRWGQHPLPEPGEGEIRIRHRAIGVNFIDTYHRSGLYPVPMPSGIGLEGAGTIEAVGPGVSDLAVGNRVAYCSGPIGAYADAHVIKAERAVLLPDWLDDDTAAASLLKGLTVQYLIRQIQSCTPETTVLFHAAAGGVGQIAMQWLRHLGSTVIATAGGEAKCEIARRLGADHVIDYHATDVAPAVRAFTDGRGVDVVYDGVGASTWLASLDSLRPRGLMVSFGNASGPVRDVDLGILSAKGSLFVTRPTLVHYTATRDMLQAAAADFFATLQTGAVQIAKPAVYPLEDAVTAHKDLEARKTTGSVILRPSS